MDLDHWVAVGCGVVLDHWVAVGCEVVHKLGCFCLLFLHDETFEKVKFSSNIIEIIDIII